MMEGREMEKNLVTIGLSRNLKVVCVAVCCVLVLFATSAQVYKVSALFTPLVLFEPVRALELSVGQNITVTVNVTDMPDLFLWQVVLEYNGSVVNLTDLSTRRSDCPVFAGHAFAALPDPEDTEAPGDYLTTLNWTMVGATLFGDDSVSVSNGILFVAQFTAVAEGYSTITLMTYANPVHTAAPQTANDATYYSYLWDSRTWETGSDYHDFQTMGCTVTVGHVTNVPPVAFFTVVPPTVSNSSDLVLPGVLKPNTINPIYTYANLTTTFNATGAYAPVGNIMQYIWDFGDGNVTTVNETGPDSAIITHVFTHVGSYEVVLTVVNDGTPPLTGTYLATCVVGLVLPYYDWNPFVYTVAGLCVAGIVYYVVRIVLRARRRRRELRMRKRLAAESAQVPATVAQTA
jgi:PKD repeat protein